MIKEQCGTLFDLDDLPVALCMTWATIVDFGIGTFQTQGRLHATIRLQHIKTYKIESELLLIRGKLSCTFVTKLHLNIWISSKSFQSKTEVLAGEMSVQ